MSDESKDTGEQDEEQPETPQQESKDRMPTAHRRRGDHPTSEQIEREIRRRELVAEASRAVFRAVRTIIVFAAAAVLVVTLLFPTIQVQRGSMAPTLRDAEQVVLITVGSIKRGDIIAFHLGNQTMLKRVIGLSGEWVEINEDGTVSIDGAQLDEPYLTALSQGQYDIEFPFQVPDNQYFVMGDNRAVSMDSRVSDFGTIHKDDIIGKTLLRIWPPSRFGLID